MKYSLKSSQLNWTVKLPSCPELCRCSPRSQPNTLSLRIPRWRSFWGGGRDFMNVLRNVISFPCFLHTDNGKRLRREKTKSLGGNFKSIIQKRHLASAPSSEHCRGSCHLSVPRSRRERSPPAGGGDGADVAIREKKGGDGKRSWSQNELFVSMFGLLLKSEALTCRKSI